MPCITEPHICSKRMSGVKTSFSDACTLNHCFSGQDVEKRLASHKQQASEMLSSALADCQREDAAFLSGILEACVACREEV